MPMVIIRTGFTDPDGYEEHLSEYLCDSPDCPNIAVHVAGFSKELGIVNVLCEEHARQLRLQI